LPPPLSFVDVVVVVVVEVEVVGVVLDVVVVVVGVVVVGAVVVVGGTVVGVVVVGTVVEGVDVLVVVSSPLSDAITTTATISPSTTATRMARAHLTPRLMPPFGG